MTDSAPKPPKKKAVASVVPEGSGFGAQIWDAVSKSHAPLLARLKAEEKVLAEQISNDMAGLYIMKATGVMVDSEIAIAEASLQNIAASINQKVVRAVRDTMSSLVNGALQAVFAVVS